MGPLAGSAGLGNRHVTTSGVGHSVWDGAYDPPGSLHALKNKRFHFKINGGRWVLDNERDIDQRLVGSAINRQDGSDPMAPMDDTAVREIAGRIAAQLRGHDPFH
jgi:hypothetical protein